jgi:hypothetical protein
VKSDSLDGDRACPKRGIGREHYVPDVTVSMILSGIAKTVFIADYFS